MQPKDYVEKTPENNIKLQRRLNKMAKELTLQKTAVIAGKNYFLLRFKYLKFFLKLLMGFWCLLVGVFF